EHHRADLTLEVADAAHAQVGPRCQLRLGQACSYPVAVEERCKSHQLTRDHGSCPCARCPSTAATVPRRTALSAIIASRAEGCPGGRVHLGGWLGGWLFLVTAPCAAHNRCRAAPPAVPILDKKGMVMKRTMIVTGAILAALLLVLQASASVGSAGHAKKHSGPITIESWLHANP